MAQSHFCFAATRLAWNGVMRSLLVATRLCPAALAPGSVRPGSRKKPGGLNGRDAAERATHEGRGLQRLQGRLQGAGRRVRGGAHYAGDQ